MVSFLHRKWTWPVPSLWIFACWIAPNYHAILTFSCPYWSNWVLYTSASLSLSFKILTWLILRRLRWYLERTICPKRLSLRNLVGGIVRNDAHLLVIDPLGFLELGELGGAIKLWVFRFLGQFLLFWRRLELEVFEPVRVSRYLLDIFDAFVYGITVLTRWFVGVGDGVVVNFEFLFGDLYV